MAAEFGCDKEELAITRNSSEALQIAQNGLDLKAGDEVIVTNQDHEANIGAWRRLEAAGIVVREWKIDPDTAELNPDGLDTWLGPRTRAVAFTHCSNVVATINPVRELTERIHAAGAIAIVDGALGQPVVGQLTNITLRRAQHGDPFRHQCSGRQRCVPAALQANELGNIFQVLAENELITAGQNRHGAHAESAQSLERRWIVQDVERYEVDAFIRKKLFRS